MEIHEYQARPCEGIRRSGVARCPIFTDPKRKPPPRACGANLGGETPDPCGVEAQGEGGNSRKQTDGVTRAAVRVASRSTRG